MYDVEYKDEDYIQKERSKIINPGIPCMHTEEEIIAEKESQEQESLIPFYVSNLINNKGNTIDHLNHLIEITKKDDFQITPTFPSTDFSFFLFSIFASDNWEEGDLALELLGFIWRSKGVYPEIINPEMFQILFNVYNQENTTLELQSKILTAITPLVELDFEIREYLLINDIIGTISKYLLYAVSEIDIKSAFDILIIFAENRTDSYYFYQIGPHIIHIVQNENANIRGFGLKLLKKLMTSSHLLKWFADLGILKMMVLCAEKSMIEWNPCVFDIILCYIRAGYTRAFSNTSIYTSISWCLRNCKEFDVSSAINIIWYLSDDFFDSIDKCNTYMEILSLTDSAVFANRFASCRVLSKYMCICDTENLIEVAENGGLLVISENIENLEILCQLDAIHALARLVQLNSDRFIEAMVENGLKDSIEEILENCEDNVLEQKINEFLELVVVKE